MTIYILYYNYIPLTTQLPLSKSKNPPTLFIIGLLALTAKIGTRKDGKFCGEDKLLFPFYSFLLWKKKLDGNIVCLKPSLILETISFQTDEVRRDQRSPDLEQFSTQLFFANNLQGNFSFFIVKLV